MNTSGSYHAIAGGKKVKIKKPKIKAAIKSIKPIGGGRGGGGKMPKMASMKTPSLGGGGGKRKRNML